MVLSASLGKQYAQREDRTPAHRGWQDWVISQEKSLCCLCSSGGPILCVLLPVTSPFLASQAMQTALSDIPDHTAPGDGSHTQLPKAMWIQGLQRQTMNPHDSELAQGNPADPENPRVRSLACQVSWVLQKLFSFPPLNPPMLPLPGPWPAPGAPPHHTCHVFSTTSIDFLRRFWAGPHHRQWDLLHLMKYTYFPGGTIGAATRNQLETQNCLPP